jgi:superfamily II RNA helicase
MSSLADRIPETGFRSPDEALDAFLGWVAERGLTLHPHQEEAILEVFAGHHVVLDTPTGSGKSLVALARHFLTFAFVGRSVYTAPIKALVSEKFFELCHVFGAEFVGLATGDGAVNPTAPILCCTAEVLSDQALREGPAAKITSVVMDEFHYYGDKDRGAAWQIPLLTLPDTTFLLMSATLGDTGKLREDLEARTQRKVSLVQSTFRPVPLTFSWSLSPLHEALQELARSGRTPAYVVHFTQSAATETAQSLMSIDWCSKERKAAIAAAIKGVSFSSPFGPTLKRFVSHGIGLHHAGLLPRYRLLVEKLAQQGLLEIISGTDTLGVGINVPIRTVLFTRLCKFDGEKVILLPVREFRQIAGRAGRAGFDTQGWVVVQAPEHVIENARIDRIADDKKRKRTQRAQPPTWGYKHWDENTFRGLVERPAETLESRFTVDHGKLLSVLKHAEETEGDAGKGLERLRALIRASHATAAQKQALDEKVDALLEHLVSAALVTRDGDRLALDPTLPRDYSLHHALSVFLVAALTTLNPASDTHALDVVTWVEAILDDPRAVLQRQVEREKERVVNELKAQGVPYEERMERLEEVSWPKPNADQLWAFFHAYRAQHPWVGEDALRPKSVVRAMLETWASFGGYVKELGLQRAEGVLLRYVHDAWRVLDRTIPPEHRTERVLDLTANLRAMLGRVDSSLLTEWERMVGGVEGVAPPEEKRDISEDPRAFAARVRAELHAVVRALATGDLEEAVASLCATDDRPDERALEAALAPVLASYGALGFDHRARRADATQLRRTGPHTWEVVQRLWPPDRGSTQTHRVEGWEDEAEEAEFFLTGAIDLRDDTDPVGPIVRFVSLG